MRRQKKKKAVQKKKNVTIRMADETRAWLERNGKPLARQLRLDLMLLRGLKQMADEDGTAETPVGEALKRLEKLIEM